jgi:hypothetical protein
MVETPPSILRDIIHTRDIAKTRPSLVCWSFLVDRDDLAIASLGRQRNRLGFATIICWSFLVDGDDVASLGRQRNRLGFATIKLMFL